MSANHPKGINWGCRGFAKQAENGKRSPSTFAENGPPRSRFRFDGPPRGDPGSVLPAQGHRVGKPQICRLFRLGMSFFGRGGPEQKKISSWPPPDRRISHPQWGRHRRDRIVDRPRSRAHLPMFAGAGRPSLPPVESAFGKGRTSFGIHLFPAKGDTEVSQETRHPHPPSKWAGSHVLNDFGMPLKSTDNHFGHGRQPGPPCLPKIEGARRRSSPFAQAPGSAFRRICRAARCWRLLSVIRSPQHRTQERESTNTPRS